MSQSLGNKINTASCLWWHGEVFWNSNVVFKVIKVDLQFNDVIHWTSSMFPWLTAPLFTHSDLHFPLHSVPRLCLIIGMVGAEVCHSCHQVGINPELWKSKVHHRTATHTIRSLPCTVWSRQSISSAGFAKIKLFCDWGKNPVDLWCFILSEGQFEKY